MTLCVIGITPARDGRLCVRFKGGKRMSYARLVAAIKIGRPLRPEELVHHINGDFHDDRFANLLVMPSRSEHSRLHIVEINARRYASAVCGGCGGDLDARNTDCLTCANRHRRRVFRQRRAAA